MSVDIRSYLMLSIISSLSCTFKVVDSAIIYCKQNQQLKVNRLID